MVPVFNNRPQQLNIEEWILGLLVLDLSCRAKPGQFVPDFEYRFDEYDYEIQIISVFYNRPQQLNI